VRYRISFKVVGQTKQTNKQNVNYAFSHDEVEISFPPGTSFECAHHLCRGTMVDAMEKVKKLFGASFPLKIVLAILESVVTFV